MTASPARQNTPEPVPGWLTRFIATGFFSGYSPVASGTAGSLVGLLIYFIPGASDTRVLLPLTIAVLILGVLTSRKMERAYGEDPSIVVIDEIAGMWISLLFIRKSIIAAIAAFFLFRLFDIVKPPPARQAERLGGGVGIMLDDVFAAIYANLLLRAAGFLFPSVFSL
ncbi:MAG TPA: phosphatidylglycerophosphatase A [Bacteroidota bacterium]|nr:phosphatidylglycerophosphatase A [Bacteroidota bacterium]